MWDTVTNNRAQISNSNFNRDYFKGFYVASTGGFNPIKVQ